MFTEKLRDGSSSAEDSLASQLRRLELERPDDGLRQRVLADVDAVLKRPRSPRYGFKPVLAGAIATACWVLLLLEPWTPSDSRPEIPSAYVEATAQWLDLSPELAHHVVRPVSSPNASNPAPALEGRLRHADDSAIDL